MKRIPKRKAGQAMVEYVIIVVVVAISALVIFGLFGDTIQKKMGAAIEELDGDSSGGAKTRLEDLGESRE
jgi:Flp pilus assembly pilin Flp